MGWYADIAWRIRLKDSDVEALANELLGAIDTGVEDEDPAYTIVNRLCYFGEDGEGVVKDVDGEPTLLEIIAWSSGKSHDYGPEPDIRQIIAGDGHQFEVNYGGAGIYSILAKYCTGSVDWVGEDQHWRVRFMGDGTWTGYDGEVVYPGDTPEPWES